MDSDDEGEEERHFKLGHEKKWEAVEKVLDDCRKHAKISDFNAMDSDLPSLENVIKKNAANLFKEKGEKLPCRVLKVLMLFEDTINEVTNAMKKKMSKINASAHNKLKQKLKKFLQGTGEGEYLYETQLNAYRENPQDSEEEKKEESDESEAEEAEEEEEEEEEDEEDEDAKAAAAGAAQEAAKEKGAKENDEYGDYYDEEDYDQEDDAEGEDEIFMDNSAEINPKLRQKYAFLWKTREEMTASERRWKWVKKESLPADLSKLMDQLTGKKKKDKAAESEDGEDGRQRENKEREIKEEALTLIKCDYLSMDFKLYVTCQEILEALKKERLQSKYSPEYHTQVLTKIY